MLTHSTADQYWRNKKRLKEVRGTGRGLDSEENLKKVKNIIEISFFQQYSFAPNVSVLGSI